MPTKAATPRNASSVGRERTSLAPARPVCAMCANAPRPSRGAGVNRVSGIQPAHGERDRPYSAEHDREADVDEREPDARADPEHGGPPPDLRAPEVHARQALVAHPAREPRVHRAAREPSSRSPRGRMPP